MSCNFMSCNFMSCIFMPCNLVHHFHVRHFQHPRLSVVSVTELGMDWIHPWIGLDGSGFSGNYMDWIGSYNCFINIICILTTDKRWRCNTMMCILADFNRLWLDCEFYKTLPFRLLFYDMLSSRTACCHYSSTVECLLFKCNDCWLADVQLYDWL